MTVNFGDYDLTLPSNLLPDVGVAVSVDAITAGLQHLANLGARHFLVSNLRFVTLAPEFTDPSADLGAAKALYDEFNATLSAKLDGFQASTGLDVKQLDLHSLFDSIAADPSDFCFQNVAEPVLANATIPGTVPAYNPAIAG